MTSSISLAAGEGPSEIARQREILRLTAQQMARGRQVVAFDESAAHAARRMDRLARSATAQPLLDEWLADEPTPCSSEVRRRLA